MRPIQKDKKESQDIERRVYQGVPQAESLFKRAPNRSQTAKKPEEKKYDYSQPVIASDSQNNRDQSLVRAKTSNLFPKLTIDRARIKEICKEAKLNPKPASVVSPYGVGR